jgi:hypothetical protein
MAIRGNANGIYSNYIERSGLSAIIFEFGADGNRVGGETPESENVIEHSEQSPIFLSPFLNGSTRNEIGRNHGTGNGGAFILTLSGNEGVAPPVVTTAHPTVASGTATPEAVVRVFETGEGTGDLDRFLGEVAAEEDGDWTAELPVVAVGANIAATQTVEGATSEFTGVTAVTAEEEESGGGEEETGGGGGGSGGGDTGGGGASATGSTAPSPPPAPPAPVEPTVKITAHPKKSSAATTAKFKFTATPATGASFECKLDGKKWAKCKSPKTYKALKPGRHTFQVRATVPGAPTSKPAKFQFTVKP